MRVLRIVLLAGVFGMGTVAHAETLKADSGFAVQALKGCQTDLRYLNQVIGWQVKWPRQWQNVVAEDEKGIHQAIATWSQAPESIRESIVLLRLGLESNEAAPYPVVVRVHQQLRDLVSSLREENSKYTFATVESENTAIWNRLVRDEISPAISEFEQFLEKEYLPETDENPGLSKIEGGEECFLGAITWWTSLTPSQVEIAEIGERYLSESREQLLATGGAGDTVDSVLARLRDISATNTTTVEELMTISEAALARAHDKTLLSFEKQAKTGIVVSEMPVYLQRSAPAGYYSRAQAAAPARYIINPSRPNERRLMAEVIAFHEGIPGHHLWVEYPREQPSTGYNSGILEGWALYSEYLADEMDLYSSNYDRQGMITKHLWAASRLIVEPGIHLNGWTREEAIEFMMKYTVMSRAEIEIEIDRYIAMPGQSLSYILGADFILSERQRAKELLGDAFELSEFHDVILQAGVRSLPEVGEDINAWIQTFN